MSESTTALPLNLLVATDCAHNHACLTDKSWCDTDLFNDRDVLVVRCKESRRCCYRRKYVDLHVCSCPTKTALSFGLI
jgi:hypothetical protein